MHQVHSNLAYAAKNRIGSNSSLRIHHHTTTLFNTLTDYRSSGHSPQRTIHGCKLPLHPKPPLLHYGLVNQPQYRYAIAQQRYQRAKSGFSCARRHSSMSGACAPLWLTQRRYCNNPMRVLHAVELYVDCSLQQTSKGCFAR